MKTEKKERSRFNPEDIGVSNAHIWNTINKKKEKE
jgi:hypothetical protein